MDKPFYIHQTLLKVSSQPIRVVPVHEADANATVALTDLLATSDETPLGLAGAYEKGQLVCLSLSSPTRVVLFRFAASAKSKGKKKKAKNASSSAPGRAMLVNILTEPDLFKIGDNMDRLVTALFSDLNILITAAMELALLKTAKKSAGLRGATDDLVSSLGGDNAVADKEQVKRVFSSEKFSGLPQELTRLALRAWASTIAGSRSDMQGTLVQAPKYDTVNFDHEQLTVLAKLKRDQDLLDALKPTMVKNDVEPNFSNKKGSLELKQTRFSTRMRTSANQHIIVEYKTASSALKSSAGGAAKSKGGETLKVTGRTVSVKGKAAEVQIKGVSPMAGVGKISGVYTIGKEEPTSAETARALIVRSALLKQSGVLQTDMARKLWLPSNKPPPPPPSASGSSTSSNTTTISWDKRPLNPSQSKAVRAIMDNQLISVIHGGPGTGKTTVIAASVMSIIEADPKSTMWLVAQSNVAVKNIAEKLADCDFLDFKILVSKDFHFDWHEHLYIDLQRNVIRTDDLPHHIVGTERVLCGSRVILCTMSMLSNNRMMSCGLPRLVPVQTVIVDEASQIEVGDYLPMVDRFKTTLKKIACIGDDKQLPPYGQDDVPGLKIVFEVEYLRRNDVFLDTQYRMPVPLGHFISKHVYARRLKTVHPDDTLLAVRLIDIPGSEASQGRSWINLKEVQAVVHLARVMQATGRSFRIVTPYDAQRSRIEDALKHAKVKWEDKVFNVDSFQGNEDDYIIVSLVRTVKVGFLSNQRRTNVMLSRCKKGMVLCANKSFLTGNPKASKTLVGKLAAEWMAAGAEWVEWSDLLGGRM